ncbi:MAG TPA: hypothetical protein VGX96_10870 [Candidatus Elarobacter sp.]|jgi:hypothetical protein|nr:hypothetical protein [Candidatus Elarobacter sp.]
MMIRRLLAALAVAAFVPASATAQTAVPATRGSADAVLAGTWKITWNLTTFGGMMTGGHYVQIYSDRRVHWTDSVRTFNPRSPSELGTPRCEDSTELAGDDFAAMQDVVRAVYNLQLPDMGSGVNSAFLEVTVARGGRDYVAGLVHYAPSLENLDPRLKRAQAIFARFACPPANATPRPIT